MVLLPWMRPGAGATWRLGARPPSTGLFKTHLFKTQLADEITGMENDTTAFCKQMFLKDAIPGPAFMCFSRAADTGQEGLGVRALTFGGDKTSLGAASISPQAD